MYRASPQYFKHILINAGLRTSLPRVKVLLALEGGQLTARQLHDHLVSAGEHLSLVSVFQVIGRLCERNIVVRAGQGRYHLNQAVLSVLGGGVEGSELCTVDE